jgi:hypothetical protein
MSRILVLWIPVSPDFQSVMALQDFLTAKIAVKPVGTVI